MRRHHFVLIASLIAGACEDDLDDRTEKAADRAAKASDHLRHQRRELSEQVAERANAVAAHRETTPYARKVAREVADVTRESGALAEAEHDFEELRALRVEALRAEYAVAASQPLLIVAIAGVKPLPPTARARLDENLVIFRHRLAQTKAAIEQLGRVPAALWEQRDDEVGHAMAGMFIARDASWQALEAKRRDVKFPET